MAPHDDVQNILIPFYRGVGRDHQNRKLDEILSWPDQLLEECHDYIQTLFPLPEASRFSWKATLVDRHVFEAFRATPELREGLSRSFNRMLSFYGLQVSGRLCGVGPQDGKVVIRRAANFPSRSLNWVTRVHHNHLRITRIIRSLRILGLEKEAEAFFEIISDIYMNASDRYRPCRESMKYWTRAAKRPLNYAPDVDDVSDPRSGKEFLWKYEMATAAGENLGNEGTEESQISNVTDDSDGGVLLPQDEGFAEAGEMLEGSSSANHRTGCEGTTTIKEFLDKGKAKSSQNASTDTERGDYISTYIASNGSSSSSSPTLKRKTQHEAKERVDS